MSSLTVKIARFVDPWQPGIVACEFLDAYGQLHTIIDKAPLFTSEMLDEDSLYPQDGESLCEVLDRFTDSSDRELVRIRFLESTIGTSEFVVLAEQII